MPGETRIQEDTTHVPFIVTGKVVKSKAATMPEIASEQTLILQIETIVKAPAMFASITGQQITVRFGQLPDLKDGTVITVYANGWIFGETIAVDAVEFTEASDKKELVKKVNDDVSIAGDATLKERVDSASVAVVGKVIKTQKKEDTSKAVHAAVDHDRIETTHISEHDPNWHEATIQVDEVLKGAKDAKEVTVLFPKSDDVRWYNVHKYKEGQQGVWLLQNGGTQNKKGIAPKVLAVIPTDADVLTTLHTNDFLPLSELDKIKALINK